MLSLLLLGSHGLQHGGRDIGAAVQYRKAWALLAYLAVEHERRHSREHLAQLLWPQLPSASARTNLRQVLANLNRVFEAAGAAGWLDLERDAVALARHPRACTDVQALFRFAHGPAPAAQELARIGALVPRFGAALLDGLAFPDCPEYEEWLQLARTRLAALGTEALQRIAEAHHAGGRTLDAVAIARRLVAQDEWNEAHLRLLMRLLAESGQPQQALAVYRALRASLREELDSEPEPATEALRAAIEAAAQAGAAGAIAPRPGRKRRWFTAVHCRVAGNDVERSRVCQRIEASLREAGAIVLTATANGPTACFLDDPDLAGAQRSALRAARAALAAACAHGGQAAFVLCTGLAAVEGEAAEVTPLGQPLQWIAALCAHAPPGSVAVCDALQRWLSPAFELGAGPAVALEPEGPAMPLWTLLRERRGSAGRPPALSQPADTVRDDLATQRMPTAREGGAQAWIAVLRGGEVGRRLALRGEPVVIGRASDADLQIPHRTVSRYHCLVWLEAGRVRVRDLGATNRTRVNDAPVLERELTHGDRIALGDALLGFAQRSREAPTVPVGGADAQVTTTSRAD